MRHLLILGLLTSGTIMASESDIAIAIHGGAGTITKANLSEAKEKEYRDTLTSAVTAGYKVLEKGGSSIDAVKAAIVLMEDSPLFNAGKGAVYTFDGIHELDASIMDGRTRGAGAVASVTSVKNPILLAHDVMTKSPHVMLSGKGAANFAQSLGYEETPNSYFDTQFRYDSWLQFMQEQKRDKQAVQADYTSSDYKFGTVGAVAIDKDGNLAAGTSTGGMTGKRWGRIGDSPVIGAGTYANNDSCAVSATGHGEYFIKYNVAARVCARVELAHEPLAKAANVVINQTLKSVGGDGGIIAIDNKANIAMPFNTEGMYRASIDKNGHVSVEIY